MKKLNPSIFAKFKTNAIVETNAVKLKAGKAVPYLKIDMESVIID